MAHTFHVCLIMRYRRHCDEARCAFDSRGLLHFRWRGPSYAAQNGTNARGGIG